MNMMLFFKTLHIFNCFCLIGKNVCRRKRRRSEADIAPTLSASLFVELLFSHAFYKFYFIVLFIIDNFPSGRNAIFFFCRHVWFCGKVINKTPLRPVHPKSFAEKFSIRIASGVLGKNKALIMANG